MELQVSGMLSEFLEVTTSYDYFKRDESFVDFDFNEDEPTDEQESEMEAIQKILSIEVSIYLTRRTSGCCGSIIDNLRSIRNHFINEYQEKFKKTFQDYNSEVVF